MATFKYFIAILLLATGTVFAQNSEIPESNGKYNQEIDEKTLFSSIQQEEPVHIILETDITYLQNNKRNTEYQDAKITITHNDDNTTAYDAAVKLRGNFRRMHCGFPPLK